MIPTMTVGMAVYGEFDSVWATLVGLRAMHGHGFDIVVVDNASRGCGRTRNVTAAVGGRYYHRPDLNGTSRSRDAVFQFSRTDWVVCIDSHVFIETGGLETLRWYAAANPDSKDIISGPIVGDDFKWRSTHWVPPADAPNALWGTWAYDERDKLRDPFEIPMQGLGLFAMRRASWPGFHHLFRGFGGEEGYIHEKVRQLGGKAICLPQLSWNHKFRDTDGPDSTPNPYPAPATDHVRNLLIGHRELGIDGYESLIRDRFGKKIDPQVFAAIHASIEHQVPFGVVENLPRQRILGVWYSNNSAPEKLLRASLKSIQDASAMSRHDVQIVTVPWRPVPGNPFREVLAEYTAGPGHLNIVRQIQQGMRPGSVNGHVYDEAFEPDAVCFLEHDVLYTPGYFDRIGDAFAATPSAQVVSHLDYIGLNATGWLAVKERHEPLHQIAMRYDAAIGNLHRAAADCESQGWAYLEPDSVTDGKTTIVSDRTGWVRIPPDNFAPSVHVNHTTGRFTSHGEVCYEAVSTIGSAHPYWGDMQQYWDGPTQPSTSATQSKGCGSCGEKPATPAPVAASVDDMLAPARGDFRDHIPTVRALADQCQSVAEVSMWDDKPTTHSLVASTAAKVYSFSPFAKGTWDFVRGVAGERLVTAVGIPATLPESMDLFLIDTAHTAPETLAMLNRYAPQVSRFIVIHCTETFGEVGDDGGPGVMPGIRAFVKDHPEWTVVRRDTHTHGLAVLSRDDRDKHQPPGILRKALNFTKALAAHAQAGQKLVDDARWELRMAECLTCQHRFHDVCGKCGCPVEKKTSWAEQSCPDDPPRWAAEQSQ